MACECLSGAVPLVLFLCCWFHVIPFSNGAAKAGMSVPAMYVFGDSLADAGNNNHLELSLLKADFPHNGIDYPGHKATGRFSNGNNSADFLAEKVGLPSPPPYLSLSSSSNKANAFLNGVSFASGGAGILDSTNSDQCISFNKQIDYYSTVFGAQVQQLGSAQSQNRLSKSIFTFVIGSNDLLNYVKSSPSDKLKTPAQQFVDSLVLALRGQLKRIYSLGARKFVFLGTGPIGCCPSQRHQNMTGECNVEANHLSVQYNKGVASLLQEMKTELGDMSFSFFDTSSALLEFIQKPADYGFVEVKAACCGLGDLNAKVGCLHYRKSKLYWGYKPRDLMTPGTEHICRGARKWSRHV